MVRFAPDGRVFVATKSGIINVFDSLDDTTPTQFADLRSKVHDYWDRGLLGHGARPGFTTGRPYVYVSTPTTRRRTATSSRAGATRARRRPGRPPTAA